MLVKESSDLALQLSCVVRRVATWIFVPAGSHQASAVEMVAIDPQELQAARERDLDHDA
jgi:hypothetical protein